MRGFLGPEHPFIRAAAVLVTVLVFLKARRMLAVGVGVALLRFEKKVRGRRERRRREDEERQEDDDQKGP